MANTDDQSGNDAMAAVRASKKALRKHITQALSQVAASAVEQQCNKTMALTLAIADEIDSKKGTGHTAAYGAIQDSHKH